MLAYTAFITRVCGTVHIQPASEKYSKNAKFRMLAQQLCPTMRLMSTRCQRPRQLHVQMIGSSVPSKMNVVFFSSHVVLYRPTRIPGISTPRPVGMSILEDCWRCLGYLGL